MQQDINGSGASAASVEQTLDFSEYRTGELTHRVIELVNVPEAFKTMFLNALAATLVLASVDFALIYAVDLGTLGTVVISAYCLGLSLVFGLVVGVLRLVNRSLANLESLLRLLLEVAGRVAEDYRKLRAGDTKMPGAAELIEKVYLQILIPVLEDAIEKVFGILAKPVIWGYKRTLGLAVGRLIRYLSGKVDSQREAEIQDDMEDQLREMAQSAEDDVVFTSRAADIVGAIGRRVRAVTVVPMFIAFAAAIALAVVPLIVLNLF